MVKTPRVFLPQYATAKKAWAPTSTVKIVGSIPEVALPGIRFFFSSSLNIPFLALFLGGLGRKGDGETTPLRLPGFLIWIGEYLGCVVGLLGVLCTR